MPSTRAGVVANTGWRCIGFHNGRLSMSTAANSDCTASRTAASSKTTHVNQPFQPPALASLFVPSTGPNGAIGMNDTPGNSPSNSRYERLICSRRCRHPGETRQLGPAHGREQVAQSVVEPDLGVLVVHRGLACLGGQVAHPVGEARVGRHEGATSRRGHDLVAVEREDPAVTQRARRATLVRRAERLGGVLDHRHPVAGAQRHDLVVVGTLAVQVDDHHGRRQTAGALAVRQFGGQQLGVHVPRRRVAVDESWRGAHVRDCVRRRRERERRHEHVVAGPHAERRQRQVQRTGATRHRHHARPAHERRQLGLERIEFRTSRRNPSAVERPQQGLALGRAHVGWTQEHRDSRTAGESSALTRRPCPPRPPTRSTPSPPTSGSGPRAPRPTDPAAPRRRG